MIKLKNLMMLQPVNAGLQLTSNEVRA